MVTTNLSALDYHQMFSSNRAVMLVIDPSNGQICDASAGACEYYGYSLSELTSMNIDAINTLSKEEIAIEMKRAKDSEKNHFNFCHQLSSGEVRDVEVYSNPVSMEGKTFLYSVIHDITKRVQAEKSLINERDNLKHIFESMKDGVYIVNQQYDIQFVNQSLTNEFGNYNDKKCYEYFHNRTEVCPWCKNPDVFAGKTVHWEWYSNKNQRTYDLIDTPLKDSDGNLLKLEIFRDITDRKQHEEHTLKIADFVSLNHGTFYLENLSRFAAKLYEVEYVHIATLEPDLTSVRVIAGFLDEKSIEPGYVYSLSDTPCKNVLHKGRQCIIDQVQERFPADKDLVDLQAEGYVGEPILDAEGQPIGLIVFVSRSPIRDPKLIVPGLRILASSIGSELVRKQNEKKLQSSKERLEAAASAGIIGIWDWDVANDILIWDEMMYKLYGLRQEDFTGVYEAWSSAVHPDDKTFAEEEIQAALKGEREYAPEFRVIWPDGSIHYIKAESHTTFDDEGNPLRMVGINYDITEQKNKQLWLDQQINKRTEELRQARDEADAANKAKSIFLSNMSHELRTPMHAIMSFTDLAKKRVENEKTKHYLNNIKTSGIRLTTLLDDLLDLSKLESGKLVPEFEEIDFISVVLSAIDQIGSLLDEKDISIEFNADKTINAEFDPKLIMQVIVNLLSNAIKFSPENSSIKINIGIKPSESNESRCDIIEYSVSDEGIGIPEDEIESIFDKFIQSTKTRSDSGGTGLGLPISKEIIKLHHGRIWAESPPTGKLEGSVLSFQIPVKQDNPETKS